MVEKKLNIIFFPAWFPSKQNPLAGKFVLDHAKAVSSYANVSIVHIRQTEEKFSQLFTLLEDDVEDFRTIVLNVKKFKSSLSFLNPIFYFIANIYLLYSRRDKFREVSINHVHVLTRAALLPYLIKICFGVKFIITEHWSRYLPERNTYSGRFRKIVTPFFINQSEGVIAVSKALKDAMIKQGLNHKRFHAISNPVYLSKEAIFKNSGDKGRFRVLHVSGLNDQVKNVKGILNAVRILIDRGFDFELTIIGDDDIEGSIIRSYSAQLLLDNVTFTGKIYGNELMRYYQVADVFVLNSNFETQGCVLLEAMSFGIPVIATNVGGVPEFVTKETGILIPPKSDDLLADAMARLINKDISFNPLEIRNHVIENYSYEKIGRQIADFYKRALS